jgi:hypothetical protein
MTSLVSLFLSLSMAFLQSKQKRIKVNRDHQGETFSDPAEPDTFGHE